MLNEVQSEGIIAREPWQYDRDLFSRIAPDRDAVMPAKPDITPGRDEPDYVNVRVPGGATSLMTPPRGGRKNDRAGVSVLQKSNFRRIYNE
jgi:hypothetical protein